MKPIILLLAISILGASCTYPEGQSRVATEKLLKDTFVKEFGIKNTVCEGHVNFGVDTLECTGIKKNKPYRFSCDYNSCTIEM